MYHTKCVYKDIHHLSLSSFLLIYLWIFLIIFNTLAWDEEAGHYSFSSESLDMGGFFLGQGMGCRCIVFDHSNIFRFFWYFSRTKRGCRSCLGHFSIFGSRILNIKTILDLFLIISNVFLYKRLLTYVFGQLLYFEIGSFWNQGAFKRRPNGASLGFLWGVFRAFLSIFRASLGRH